MIAQRDLFEFFKYSVANSNIHVSETVSEEDETLAAAIFFKTRALMASLIIVPIEHLFYLLRLQQ